MKKLLSLMFIGMICVTSVFADNNINQITSANIKEKTSSLEKTPFTIADGKAQEIIDNNSSNKVKITIYIDKIIDCTAHIYNVVQDSSIPALDIEYINTIGNSVHHVRGIYDYNDNKILEGDEASGFLTTILLAPGERVVFSTTNISAYYINHGVSGRYTIEVVKD